MSKNQTRIKLIILLGALLGLIRSIFFVKEEVFGIGTINSSLQGLLNTIEQNEPIEDMFEGDAMKENIYKKALEANQTKSAKEITTSLDDIRFINNDLNIEKSDLLNILYDTNRRIRVTIKNSCKNCKISKEEIEKSYNTIIQRLYSEKILKTSNNYNSTNKKFVEIRVNNQFQTISENKKSLQTLNEAAIGEDYFMNGVADDSDYDLQIDIQNIGDILFESFIAPVETVFYKLPPNYAGGGTSQNGGTNGGNNGSSAQKEELYTLLQNLLNPSGSTNTGVITNGGIIQPTDQGGDQQTTQANQTANIIETDIFETEDKSLDSFIKENDLTQKTSNQLQPIQGNICIQGISAQIPITEDEEIEIDQELLDEYLETFQEQVDSINNIYPENKLIPNIFSDISNNTTGDNNTGVNNQIIEEYVNSFFDNESAESCFNDCKTLPLDQKIICQIQCTCKMYTRPNDPDPRLKEMNEMMKLRFCMVPVQNMTVSKGKSIYSFDDILTRIQSIMHNLINGGSMLKFQKTKEFLDNPIADFSFSKILSFQLNIDLKPIFSNNSKSAKEDKKQTEIKKLQDDKDYSPASKLNLNKYIIVADPIKNKVYKEYASSPEEYAEKVEKYKQQFVFQSPKELPNNLNKGKSIILDKIDGFLNENYKFRVDMEEKLNNINSIVYSLQQKL
ncbi:MAG: hypothetical protein PHR61_05360 [Candidatus Absconditabacteria bacterium]|nr:hypothetical protein [Candidatus Absconditabacteria bacterium]